MFRHCLCLLSLAAVALAEPVAPTEVRTVRSDGLHNAFTALAKYRGQYWLAFRAGAGHNSATADIVVLRSADAKTWTEALRLDAAPDDRDPQFLTVGDRLILYDNAMTGPKLTAVAVHTDDGKTWSKPQPVYEPTFILWKPTAHAGKYWSAAHKKDEASGGKSREVHLIVSDDGLAWKKVSTVRAGNWESETTLHFEPDGKAVAFLRQKYGSPPCQILEAVAPYTEWKARAPGINHLSGHSVHVFRGTTYLFTRTMDAKRQAGSAVFTWADGKLTPWCVMPAGGDCAYAEAVEAGDDMIVSYYSTHGKTTDIYVAVIPLKK